MWTTDKRGTEPSNAAASGSLNLLVVDDNRDAAETLAMLLEIYGHQVKTVRSGEAALEVVEHELPDLVFMDLGLPGMSGLEAGSRIRAMCQGRPLRLVAVTGWDGDEDRQRCADHGFDDHLCKPVGMDEIELVLASCSKRI